MSLSLAQEKTYNQTAQVKSSTTERSFGQDGQRDSRVLLYYIIGISATLASLISILISTFSLAIPFDFSFQIDWIVASAITLSLALLLYFMAVANDLLIRKNGQTAITCAAVVCALLYPCILIDAVPLYARAAADIILFACMMMIWGRHLANVSHRQLLLITLIAFVVSGLVLTTLQLFALPVQVLIVVVLLFLSFHCHAMLNSLVESQVEMASKELTKQRITAVRGTRSSFITIGFILGSATAILLNAQASYPVSSYSYGVALLLVGITIAVFRRHNSYFFEGFIRRSLAVFFMVGILPYPFVPPDWQVAIACYLLCIGLLNLSVTITVIPELIRFNQVSPIWTIGTEVFILLLGLAMGQAVLGFAVSSGHDMLLIIICILAAVGNSCLQLVTDHQAVTLLVNCIEENDDTSGKPKIIVRWRDKLGAVANTYHLSARQREVMELLAKGRNVDYIMKQFYISRSTAKTHIYSMYRKLGIHSRQELLDLIEQINPDSLNKN